jgi:hypothetical protein
LLDIVAATLGKLPAEGAFRLANHPQSGRLAFAPPCGFFFVAPIDAFPHPLLSGMYSKEIQRFTATLTRLAAR